MFFCHLDLSCTTKLCSVGSGSNPQPPTPLPLTSRSRSPAPYWLSGQICPTWLFCWKPPRSNTPKHCPREAELKNELKPELWAKRRAGGSHSRLEQHLHPDSRPDEAWCVSASSIPLLSHLKCSLRHRGQAATSDLWNQAGLSVKKKSAFCYNRLPGF